MKNKFIKKINNNQKVKISNIFKQINIYKKKKLNYLIK